MMFLGRLVWLGCFRAVPPARVGRLYLVIGRFSIWNVRLIGRVLCVECGVLGRSAGQLFVVGALFVCIVIARYSAFCAFWWAFSRVCLSRRSARMYAVIVFRIVSLASAFAHPFLSEFLSTSLYESIRLSWIQSVISWSAFSCSSVILSSFAIVWVSSLRDCIGQF